VARTAHNDSTCQYALTLASVDRPADNDREKTGVRCGARYNPYKTCAVSRRVYGCYDVGGMPRARRVVTMRGKERFCAAIVAGLLLAAQTA